MSRGSFGPAPRQQWLGTLRDLLLPPDYTIQSLKVKSESEVAQSCPALCNPMDCSLPWTVAYRLLHPWDSPGKST